MIDDADAPANVTWAAAPAIGLIATGARNTATGAFASESEAEVGAGRISSL